MPDPTPERRLVTIHEALEIARAAAEQNQPRRLPARRPPLRVRLRARVKAEWMGFWAAAADANYRRNPHC